MIASKLSVMGLWPTTFSDITKAKAAGTTLDTAGAADIASVVIVTGGTGGVSVEAPGSPGDTMMVINATGADVSLYNGKKGQINGTANPFVITAAHAITLLCLKAKQWFVIGDVVITGTVPTGEETEEPPPGP